MQLAQARRQTTARRDLLRRPGFAQLSPAPGELDERAVSELDPDSALALLAEATGALDPRLRELARRLAGRVVLRLRGDPVRRRRGVGRLVRGSARHGGDLDLDASLGTVLEARAAGYAPSVEDLVACRWAPPGGAVAVVIDRSGSMGGERLATAALAAAVVAARAPEHYAVLAFAGDVTVLKALDEHRSVDDVIDDVLALRGHGPTDVALALDAARMQLARAGYARCTTVLLSDCRHNASGDADPVAAARSLEHLVVVAPAADDADARRFAAATGGLVVTVDRPSSVPGALAELLA